MIFKFETDCEKEAAMFITARAMHIALKDIAERIHNHLNEPRYPDSEVFAEVLEAANLAWGLVDEIR